MMKIFIAILILATSCFGQNSINNPSVGAPTGSFNVLPSVVSTGAVNIIAASTAFSIAPPAAIVNGNPLLAVLAITGNNTETITPAAGFTQIGSNVIDTNGDKVHLSVWCKIAASESGNYAFTFNNSTGLGVAAIVQMGGTTCTADVTNTNHANAATLAVTAMTPTAANELLIGIGVHTNGNPSTRLTSPSTTTQLASNNGLVIVSLPNGGFTAPAFNFVTYANATPATAGSTNAFAGFTLGFAPTTVSATTPFVANATSGSANLGPINITGGVQASGVIAANQFVAPNGGSCSAISSLSYLIQLASGANVPAICANSAGALFIDGSESFVTVATGSGAHGGPRFIVSSGDIEVVSQDNSQDLQIITSDSSNNLKIGCITAACTGQTQQADIFVNAQTAHLIHNQVNVVDRFTIGDTKNLTSAVAATILSIPLAADQTAGGTVSFSALATDTVNHLNCSTSGTVEYSGENSAGVFVTNTSIIGTNATACTVTLTNTCTFALTGANPALLQATCTLVNMASPTSFVINYNVNHLSGTVPTF